jgi:four helix bundle protein
MAVRRYQDLIAWQTGEAFKIEVYRIVTGSPGARDDHRFRSQLLEAARSVPANIVEGFLRFAPREFARFIDFSVGSLGEAESRLRDGIQLGYFADAECAAAFRLARRCLTASVRLKKSQKLFLR